MVILLVIGWHPKDFVGGAELQTLLIAKGIRILEKNTVFCAVDSNYTIEEIEPDGLKFVSLDGRLNIFHRMYNFYKLLRNVQPDGVYIRAFNSFWWVFLVCKIMRKLTIYHVSSIMYCQYRTWNHIKKWNVEKRWFRDLKNILQKDFNIFITRYADSIICQTFEQKVLIEQKLKRASNVIRNGNQVPQRSYPKSTSQFNVIWIGKHWKNPDIFIDLAKAFQNDSVTRFSMIGLFPNGEKPYYKKKETEIANFTFFGELSNDKINKLLERSHVLVNTSDYEGFSNTFIQAWMRGVPVVSLEVDPDDLLKKKKIGYHSKTIKQLEEDVRILSRNEKLYREFSHNAYLYASQEHNINKTSEQIWKLIKKISKNN